MADAHGNGQTGSQGGKTKTILKYGIAAIFGGLATTVIAGIVGIVSSAYVEISFKDPTVISTWNQWMDLHVDVVEPREYKAYYGDNDNGKTIIRDAIFSLRYFQLSKKVLGQKTRPDSVKYAIDGYWRDDQIVLTHRGLSGGGGGVYVLKAFPVAGLNTNVFSGYVVVEDWKHNVGTEDWFIKCPVVMLPSDVANSRYPDKAPVIRDFPFVTTKCVEFLMPKTLDRVANDAKSVDEILAVKN